MPTPAPSQAPHQTCRPESQPTRPTHLCPQQRVHGPFKRLDTVQQRALHSTAERSRACNKNHISRRGVEWGEKRTQHPVEEASGWRQGTDEEQRRRLPAGAPVQPPCWEDRRPGAGGACSSGSSTGEGSRGEHSAPHVSTPVGKPRLQHASPNAALLAPPPPPAPAPAPAPAPTQLFSLQLQAACGSQLQQQASIADHAAAPDVAVQEQAGDTPNNTVPRREFTTFVDMHGKQRCKAGARQVQGRAHSHMHV